MKFFISQPMNDCTHEEIYSVRKQITEKLVERFGEDTIIIDSYFKEAPVDAVPLYYLGEALKLMSEADVVVFAQYYGCDLPRGCAIELQCAKKYVYPALFVKIETGTNKVSELQSCSW